MNTICVAAWRLGACSAFVATTSLMGAALAAEPPASPEAARAPDCFEQLETGSAAEIACTVPLRLSETEQAELEKGTRGFVKDLSCTLEVRIARREIDTALAATDLTFQSPEQPVACAITTANRTHDITATFAPRIVFRNDTAVEATPGLGNVKGVTRFISWPVVQFVNRWPTIRSSLLQIVNAYRTHARGKAKDNAADAASPAPSAPAAR